MPPIYSPDLLDALEGLVQPWKGSLWRLVVGDLDPTQPNVRGARWNPPGTEALYFSLTAEGAHAEMTAVIDRQPRPVNRPLTTYQFDGVLSNVADLTSDPLASVGYPVDLLIGDRWDAPARVGGAAEWLGIAGLLVPSARHANGNLVVLVNNLGPEDVLRPST